MNYDLIFGWAVLGVPLLIIGLAWFGHIRSIVFFYIVALAIGFGYLTSTGAMQDIGHWAKGHAERLTGQRLGPAAATPPAETPRERPANPVTTVPDAPAP